MSSAARNPYNLIAKIYHLYPAIKSNQFAPLNKERQMTAIKTNSRIFPFGSNYMSAFHIILKYSAMPIFTL
jgi:hypothetical protein